LVVDEHLVHRRTVRFDVLAGLDQFTALLGVLLVEVAEVELVRL